MSLSESVELDQNTLYVYRLPKGHNTGITEYIKLENSGNDKGDDPRRQYLQANSTTTTTTTTTTTLLHLQY